MTHVSVMLLSQDPSLIDSVGRVVEGVPGCRCKAFGQVDQALEYLADVPCALAIYHATSANAETVVWLLQDMAGAARCAASIVITDDDLSTQLTFLERGAADCLSRRRDLGRLPFLVDSLTLRARHAVQEGPRAPCPIAGDRPEAFFCQSAGMAPLMRMVEKIARQDSTVLLTGETGVGKTRLARMLHDLSPRRDAPFLTVNCAALAENLLESELFGHSKGSFTGADAAREGRFRAAGEGTLFLDEVDSLPPPLQKKLLRAVDERVFEPVGSNRTQPLSARLIAATNSNLCEEMTRGRFRSDLYYRLSIIELEIPPLRERRDAIPEIATKHLQECALRNGRAVPEIAEDACAALMAFNWPGNIRELKNAIERALAFCDGHTIAIGDLPRGVQDAAARVGGATGLDVVQELPASHPSPADDARSGKSWELKSPATSHLSPLALARAQGEAERIKNALERSGNNRTRASAELGISRVALYKKLRRLGLL